MRTTHKNILTLFVYKFTFIIQAMNERNIILTGFMGTGKTTVGRLLSERLNRQFVDSDELIVARNGRSIADIFSTEGESFFRDLESQITQELAAKRGMVIATGGRLMLDPHNAELLSATGAVFCLTADPEQILARVASDDTRRPLLAGPNPAWHIRQLLHERAKDYGRFPQIITSGKSAAAVAAEIIALLDANILTVTHPNGCYNVAIGHDLLPEIREIAAINGPIALITDSNVGPSHAKRIGNTITTLTVPAGEKYKTLATVNTLYSQLLAAGVDRKCTIVTLGGGVVGDMAGFVAASYMRGVPVVQCPTSLLSMVDASVGGKTGVDLPEGKNLVGAFKQPQAVLADLTTLQTLPTIEFAAGLAEIIKHGLISNPDLFTRFESGDWSLRPDNTALLASLQDLVTAAIQVKRDIVQEDPYELGRRALLNLGHTFGHAIEQVSGYAVRHGEGVAMGLVAAAHLSAQLGHCDPRLQTRIENVLIHVGLPTRIPASLSSTEIYRAMFSDKKKAGSQLRFILIRAVGDAFFTGEVEETAVFNTLQACQF